MNKKRTTIVASLVLVVFIAVVMISMINKPDNQYIDNSSLIDLGGLLDDAVPLAEAPSIFLNTEASGVKVEKNSNASIDYSNIADGYFMAKWTGDSKAKVKLQTTGPSKVTYTYDMTADGEYDAFPFSDGDGSYKITVFKNVSGTKYSTILSKTVTVKMTDPMAPFIRPNQYINYKTDSKAVEIAAEKCSGLDDNLDKVEAVYNYVVGTITYDKDKAKTVKSGYIPDIDKVLESKKGICFDYAALMTAMLRSQNVPCKLVVGYAGSSYHAWINVWSEKDGWVDNLIYFNGKEWKLMDPTFASSGNQSSSIMKYIGDGTNYKAKYLY